MHSMVASSALVPRVASSSTAFTVFRSDVTLVTITCQTNEDVHSQARGGSSFSSAVKMTSQIHPFPLLPWFRDRILVMCWRILPINKKDIDCWRKWHIFKLKRRRQLRVVILVVHYHLEQKGKQGTFYSWWQILFCVASCIENIIESGIQATWSPGIWEGPIWRSPYVGGTETICQHNQVDGWP